MRRLIPAVIFFLLTLNLASDEPVQEPRSISLTDFIASAGAGSTFQSLVAEELSALYSEKLKTKAGDFVLSALAEYQFGYSEAFTTKTERGDQVTEAEQTHNFKGSVSLSKLFSRTGTSLSASYQIDPRGISDPSSKLSVRIEQEVVQNVFGRAYRLTKQMAGNELEIARSQVAEAYEEYLFSLMMLYFDWYSSYENVRFSRSALEESRELLDNIKEKLKFRVAHPSDVYKAELQTTTRQEQLLKHESAYRVILLQVQTVLALPPGVSDIIPAEAVLDGFDTIDVEKAVKEFSRASRTIRLFELVRKNMELDLKLSINDVLPAAKLYGGYILQGTGYIPETERSHTVTAGVSLNYSIPQPGFLAEYRKKKAEMEKQDYASGSKLSDVVTDIRILYEKMRGEKSLLVLAERKIELAEAIANEELINYNQGRSSLNNLLSVYNTLEENRLAYKNRLVQLSRYYIEWLRLTDTLVKDTKTVNF